MHKINGTYCAALTPLNSDYTINQEMFLDHCNYLLSQGIDGLGVFGTTGEANSFSVKEKIEAIHYIINNSIDVDKIIPGTGLCSVSETVMFSKEVASLKVKAVLVLPTFYYNNVSNMIANRFVTDDDDVIVYQYHNYKDVNLYGLNVSLFLL